MQSQQVTGLALIVGALAMIVAIAIHPQHRPVESTGDMAWPNIYVTVVVLASLGTLGVGFLRLFRSTAAQLWNDVAVVMLALAGVCGSLAALTGHLMIPRLLEHANAADKSDEAIVSVVVANDLIVSAALIQTSFAAWAIGVLCLSISMLQGSTGWKSVGACGIVLGLSILVALLLGRLQISLHDVALVVLGSGIWLIAIGAGLCAHKSFAEFSPQ